MNITDVPIWEKYTLTIEEASKYFRIGENKLRKLAEENPAAGWVIMNGNRMQNQRKNLFIVLPQGMIIRTTLSKWVMCSDLSFLLRIL